MGKIKNIDEGIRKAAKDFKANMQEVVDNAEGFSSISMKVGDGDWHTIAEKKSDNQTLNTKTMKEEVKKPEEKRYETLNTCCDLTDEEMLAISRDMSEHINKLKAAEDTLSAFSAQIKSEIKGHQAIINKNSTLISAGKEWRLVKCEVALDASQNKVVWIRTDTGEIHHTESPIPNRYLQKELELE